MGIQIFDKYSLFEKKHPTNLYPHPDRETRQLVAADSVYLSIAEPDGNDTLDLSQYGISLTTETQTPDVSVTRVRPAGFEPLLRPHLWGVYEGSYSELDKIFTNIYNDVKPLPIKRVGIKRKDTDFEYSTPVESNLFVYAQEMFWFTEEIIANEKSYPNKVLKTEIDGISCVIIGQCDVDSPSLSNSIIHDVLFFDGEDYTNYEYKDRIELIKEEVLPVLSEYFNPTFVPYVENTGQLEHYKLGEPTSRQTVYFNSSSRLSKVRVLLTCTGAFVAETRYKFDILTGNKGNWFDSQYLSQMFPAYISDLYFTRDENSVTIEDIRIGASLYTLPTRLIDFKVGCVTDVFPDMPIGKKELRLEKNIYAHGEEVKLAGNAVRVYRQLEDELRYLLHTRQSNAGFANNGFGQKEVARRCVVPGCSLLLCDELQPTVQD